MFNGNTRMAATSTFCGTSAFLLREKTLATTRSTLKFNRLTALTVCKCPQRGVRSIRQPLAVSGWFGKKQEAGCDEAEEGRLRWVELLKQSKEMMMMMRSDGGEARWFKPLECALDRNKSPSLLYLPGIDGIGLGLGLHHKRLAEMFDIWNLHIPATDRTPFEGLVELVERKVRSQAGRSPNMPIYLVGESFGACLALSVAARNPDIDLLLILANPATCIDESFMQRFKYFIEFMPDKLLLTLLYMLGFMTGIPLKMAMATLKKRLPLQQTVGEISEMAGSISSNLSVLADVFPKETLLWKLQLLRSGSAYANSCLHAVKAQTLVLTSGGDLLLPSLKEGKRLRRELPKCDTRSFSKTGHPLFLEDGFDLITIIKGTSFYRRARCLDYVSDYIPPTPSEFKKIHQSYRWIELATAPVMLSTLEDGKIVKGLDGIPSEGPVLYVSNHMLLGLESVAQVCLFKAERNITVRTLSHPVFFNKFRDRKSPEVSPFDKWRMIGLDPVSAFDDLRMLGVVPVSAANFYRLLSSKSHILLYPGGAREALHRKGEEYKLFWPEQPEFVRMAARFGATIVPVGAVGEDDIAKLLLDYDDLMRIPFIKKEIANLTTEAEKLRVGVEGEVANQDMHIPIVAPKIPGRYYYLFGKPIETRGREQELSDREKARELYLEVKSEIERCIGVLKEKREHDPYRAILSRLIFHIKNGFDTEVPTFEL